MEAAIDRARAALATGTADEVRKCLSLLDGDTSGPSLDVIASVLGGPHWNLRRLAANMLIEMGDVVTAKMSELTRAANPDQVYWACFVLARLGSDAQDPLMAVLRSSEAVRRQYAIHALAKRKGDEAVRALIEALDDAAWSNRQRAADFLAARSDRDRVVELIRAEIALGNRNRIYWGVRVLARVLESRALPVLRKLLLWKDDDLRYLAISALGNLKSPEVLPLLLDYLADRAQVVRERTVDALAGFGTAAIGPLVERLAGWDSETRYWALRALARIDERRAFEIAVADLAEGDEERRYAAVRTLGSMRSEEALARLLDCFNDRFWVVRKFASDQVASVGEPAIGALERAMASPSDDVRYWAIVSLGKMGRPALRILREALSRADRDTRSFAISALAESSVPGEAVRVLSVALGDEHWPLRRQAAEAITAFGLEGAGLLFSLAFDRHEHVRYWSRRILKEVAGERAAALIAWLDREPETQRARAAQGLAPLDPRALDEMLDLPPETLMAALAGRPAARAGLPSAALLELASRRAEPAAQVVPDDARAFLIDLLDRVAKAGASDLHLRARDVPRVRVGSSLDAWGQAPLASADVERLLDVLLSPATRETYQSQGKASLSIGLGSTRHRVRVFRDVHGPTLVFRPLPPAPPATRDVQLEPMQEGILQAASGLVLIAGPAGSGRTWTLAAAVAHLGARRARHIAVVESPLEILQASGKAAITQREVPIDTPTYAQAIADAVAADADVLALGELPDGAAGLAALDAAQQGKLVLAVVTSDDAVGAIDHLLDLVPTPRVAQARQSLARTLRGVLWQTLVPRAEGVARIAARETLACDQTVLARVAAGDLDGVRTLLDSVPTPTWVPLDEDLERLLRRGLIKPDTARRAGRASGGAAGKKPQEKA